MMHYRVEPRPERPGVLVTLDVEAATLVADALDVINPEDADVELSARDLAHIIRNVAAQEDS